jgi:hypothetical protein
VGLRKNHLRVPLRGVQPSAHWAAEIVPIPNGEEAFLDTYDCPLKLSDFFLSHCRCRCGSVDPRHRKELPWIVVEAEASSLSALQQASSWPSSFSFPVQHSHIAWFRKSRSTHSRLTDILYQPQ